MLLFSNVEELSKSLFDYESASMAYLLTNYNEYEWASNKIMEKQYCFTSFDVMVDYIQLCKRYLCELFGARRHTILVFKCKIYNFRQMKAFLLESHSDIAIFVLQWSLGLCKISSRWRRLECVRCVQACRIFEISLCKT